MWKSANGKEADIDELETYLVNHFGLYGGYESIDAWIMWRRSNFTTLPFDGGWWDQPKWIRDDFLKLDIRRQWHDLNAKRPDVSHLKDPYKEFDYS